MRVVLAGINIDAGTIEEAQDLLERAAVELPRGKTAEAIAGFRDRAVWSPETLSAAYARISRDPAPVPELRERARRDVEAARRSNRNIIFGMGHVSVAEHAVFNLDILGVSRLAMEEIERHRLCSFTEKSQRYITLEDDIFVPAEVTEAGLGERFAATMREQFKDYSCLYDPLFELACARHQEKLKEKKGRLLLEGKAKEDARYILTLAVPGQLGMTANARNLELMLSRLAAHPLAELREFARRLEEAVSGIAPSLIKYTGGAEHLRRADAELRTLVRDRIVGHGETPASENGDAVRLLFCPADGDNRVAAALLFASGGLPMARCVEEASTMGGADMEELFRASLRRLRSWDPVQRAYEAVNLSYEVVISASCFAQLKRHRMATLIAQGYDPALGVTIPGSIDEAGELDRFRKAIARAEDLYSELLDKAPVAAAYALTNAHRRRVLFNCNLRELYHLARLRMDRHAQWDIRRVVTRMVELASARLPLATKMVCGKDGFAELHKKVFGGG